MKFLPLIWAGLWRKRIRTILTLLSVIVAFLLYGILDGVTSAFDHAIDRLTDASRMRVQNRINIVAGLPRAYMARIERIPGVIALRSSSFFAGYYRDPANAVGGDAFEIERLGDVNSDFLVPAEYIEAMRQTRSGAIVGPELLERFSWSVGDRVTLKSSLWRQKNGSNDWVFDIVGSYTLREGVFPATDEFWINYDYFDEARDFANGTVTLYIVKAADARRAPQVAAAIDAMFRNSADETLTQIERDAIRAQMDRVGDIRFIVNAIVGAVLFALLFLTGNTMMQSIRERIPELAVLKTYGFGNGTIALLVVAESLLLCLTGAVVGLAVAAVVFPTALDAMGIAALPLETSVVVAGVPIAALLALASAMPPTWHALRLNVVDALGGR